MWSSRKKAAQAKQDRSGHDHLIELQDIYKIYQMGDVQVRANDGISFTIDEGEIRIDGQTPGTATKQIVSYLPERTYLDRGMKVKDVVRYFADFYSDFDTEKANRLIKELGLDDKMKIGTMSKGMQEKLQLILVMARKAKLYILDEPLGGVDPATRDYILDTILSNFAQGATVVLSTHLIADIERILDEVIIIEDGEIKQHVDADTLRGEQNCSIDEYFRRTYKW